jgi:copper ion binding protein
MEANMKKQISIKGMSCFNCVRHVEEALNEVPGVRNIQVNLQEKSAVMDVDDQVTDAGLKKAIEEVGYIVMSINDI